MMSANRIAGRVFTIKARTLSGCFTRACQRARIENFRIHDARHTFASQALIQSGAIDALHSRHIIRAGFPVR
jgi:hypothetical protein